MLSLVHLAGNRITRTSTDTMARPGSTRASPTESNTTPDEAGSPAASALQSSGRDPIDHATLQHYVDETTGMVTMVMPANNGCSRMSTAPGMPPGPLRPVGVLLSAGRAGAGDTRST